MAKLNWDGNDFQNSQDSSGTSTEKISGGGLKQGYNHGSLTRGLVAYYPMEKGEGEVLHDGAMDNLGQINGATWNLDSMTGGNSLSFDGSDDRVETERDLEAKGDFTLAVWVKIDSGEGGAITDNYDGNYPQVKLRVHNGEFSGRTVGAVRLRLHDNSGDDELVVDTSETVDDGTWHHIVGLRREDTIEVYIDGVRKAQNSNSAVSTDLRQGVRYWGARPDGRSGEYFSGLMEDARAYDRALSKPEIEALYNFSQTSGIKQMEKNVLGQKRWGKISRYKLNGNADDAWGGNNGTNNGVTFNSGVYGRAGSFDGGSDIDTGSKFFGGSQWTVSSWFTTSSTNKQAILGTFDGNFPQVKLAVNEAGNNQVGLRVHDGSTETEIRSSVSVTDSSWYFVSAQRNEDNFKIYLGSRLVNKTTQSYQTDLSSGNVHIGARPDKNNYFKGKIDDVRIYDRALTPVQVEKLYHKGAYRIPRKSTLQ